MQIRMLISACCLILTAGLLTGCTSVMPPMAAPAPAAPAPQPTAGELTVAAVRARPAPMAGGNGAAYLTILNGLDQDVRLASAASPNAKVVEIHETIAENGVMRMVPQPDGFVIPAGTALELMPGGKHIMLFDLTAPLAPGDTLTLTLSFDTGATMTLTVPVMEVGDVMGAMSGMMHGQDEMGAADMGGEQGHEMHAAGEPMHGAPEAASELQAAFMALPSDDLYAMGEELAAGKLEPGFAATAAELVKQLDAAAWPEEHQATIMALRTQAEELERALTGGDPVVAASLAKQLHDQLHKLEHQLAPE